MDTHNGYKSEYDKVLMSLEEAVELVVFAFQKADTGDIMVQKAPASTIGTCPAIKELFNVDNEIKIIGTRHGENGAKPCLPRKNIWWQRIWEIISGFRRIKETLTMISISWKETISFL